MENDFVLREREIRINVELRISLSQLGSEINTLE